MGGDDCFAPVYSPKETLENPHLIGRGMATKMQDPKRGEIIQIGFPAVLSEEPNNKRIPAPSLGKIQMRFLAI